MLEAVPGARLSSAVVYWVARQPACDASEESKVLAASNQGDRRCPCAGTCRRRLDGVVTDCKQGYSPYRALLGSSTAGFGPPVSCSSAVASFLCTHEPVNCTCCAGALLQLQPVARSAGEPSRSPAAAGASAPPTAAPASQVRAQPRCPSLLPHWLIVTPYNNCGSSLRSQLWLHFA
jgi:hypothetical protein